MENKVIKIQIRQDTEANWETANPILALGEPAIALDDIDQYSFRGIKIGDGHTDWLHLDYMTGDYEGLLNAIHTLEATVYGTEETDGLDTRVENLETKTETLETVVGNEENGLVKDVTDLQENLTSLSNNAENVNNKSQVLKDEEGHLIPDAQYKYPSVACVYNAVESLDTRLDHTQEDTQNLETAVSAIELKLPNPPAEEGMYRLMCNVVLVEETPTYTYSWVLEEQPMVEEPNETVLSINPEIENTENS